MEFLNFEQASAGVQSTIRSNDDLVDDVFEVGSKTRPR